MNESRGHAFIRNTGFFIDQFAFPVLIAYFILEKCVAVAQIQPAAFESLRRLLTHGGRITDGIACARFLSENLVILYNSVSLWALLIRKKPYQKSETIREIIVPIITIGIYFSLNLLSYIPVVFNPPLVPEKYLLTLSLAGSFFVFAGLAVSAIAIFQLRHSFAVLIQVRDVVSKGLYRHARHPIYLGYFIQMFGFLLVIPCLWTVIWVIMSGSLFILRARLEERKITAYFPAYRDYMKRTPFLILFLKK